MANKVKVYQYDNCSTCKKALKYLQSNEVPFQSIDIVSSPPSKKELKAMLGHVDGQLKKLFNTSGKRYRELKLTEKLKNMTSADAIDLLAKDGMLVKRPFVLTRNAGTVGFNDKDWDRLIK